MTHRIAVVAQGGMGAGLAKALNEKATVLTSLEGRGPSSAARAREAGMQDVGDAGLMDADVILSVVPPDNALELARRLADHLRAAEHKPIYIDCNAVAPETARRIGEVVSATGAKFVDGGIIGMPPRPGYAGPLICVSGEHAGEVDFLNQLGIRIGQIAGPVGAASALKMSYAGITKGLIALASIMALASSRAGVGEELAKELASSQPALFASFCKSVPDMLPKAGRWVREMHEISDYVGKQYPEAAVYSAFAELYARIAEDRENRQLLESFYRT
ncbi:MAG: NAD(P)-dependent oxidoreductase [Hyphomicrobiaceae bacterium]|nr:NAD(P)-dependent oxidoreductase [Hyphomicrobiaceae bacterium]